jgi:hypothetical protein
MAASAWTRGMKMLSVESLTATHFEPVDLFQDSTRFYLFQDSICSTTSAQLVLFERDFLRASLWRRVHCENAKDDGDSSEDQKNEIAKKKIETGGQLATQGKMR